MSKKPSFYFENLDGLRALAALAVIFAHGCSWLEKPDNPFYERLVGVLSYNWDGGSLGVKFFFILSGFLITFLLLREHQSRGKITLSYFYYRRFLRIWPLYYASIFIGFVVYPMLRQESGPFHESASGLAYTLFLTNFDNITNYRTCGILGVQWSVAIEEQFYLLWPLLMILALKMRRQVAAFSFLVLIIASDIFYLGAQGVGAKTYHLFSNIRFLAFGGLLGYLSYYRLEWVEAFLKRFSKASTFAVYTVSLALLFVVNSPDISIPKIHYLVHPVQFLFFGFVILEQNYSEASFVKLKRFKWLTHLGKISYGLYLLHMVAIYIILGIPALQAEWLFIPNLIILVALTVLISHLSYTYFESYFLRLKSRYSTAS